MRNHFIHKTSEITGLPVRYYQTVWRKKGEAWGFRKGFGQEPAAMAKLDPKAPSPPCSLRHPSIVPLLQLRSQPEVGVSFLETSKRKPWAQRSQTQGRTSNGETKWKRKYLMLGGPYLAHSHGIGSWTFGLQAGNCKNWSLPRTKLQRVTFELQFKIKCPLPHPITKKRSLPADKSDRCVRRFQETFHWFFFFPQKWMAKYYCHFRETSNMKVRDENRVKRNPEEGKESAENKRNFPPKK